MNIEYRNLLPNESKAYRAIRLESLEKFPESFGANYQEALQTEKFRIENDIESQSLERFVFGAFADQELIGICAFVKDDNHTGNIYQMYVRKGFQGKNIGLGLIQAIIREAYNRFKEIEIVLEVTPKNNRAYHLYKKIGFQELIDEKNPESNIVMKYIR